MIVAQTKIGGAVRDLFAFHLLLCFLEYFHETFLSALVPVTIALVWANLAVTSIKDHVILVCIHNAKSPIK